MRRVSLPASALFVVAATMLSGCASSHARQSSRSQLVGAGRGRVAAREAGAVLRRFTAPPNAVRTQGPLRSGTARLERRSRLADRFAVWRVGEPFSAVLSYVRAHPPDGFRFDGVSSLSAGGPPPATALVSFSGYGRRFLDVTISQPRRRVVIRVDARVGWFYSRSPAETVPPAAREIDVRARVSVGPTGAKFGPTGRPVSRRVTDPAKVAKLVRWFDNLPISQPGPAPSCGVSELDAGIDLVFRSASGTQLASAWVPFGWASECDSIGFSIHGKEQRRLVDYAHGPPFSARVAPLLGCVRARPLFNFLPCSRQARR